MNAVTRRQLLELARRAARSAYCPYSGFHVGAALLADDGRLVTGANVENASYGLTLCAERTALFAAAASGMRRVRALAVTCPDAADDAAPVYRMPCGACRQAIAEFAAPDLIVYVDRVADYRLDDLLPQAFRLPAPPTTADRPRRRVVTRLAAPPELAASFDVGDGITTPFALVTASPEEALAAALAGLHAVVLGAGGEIVHGCRDWAEAVALLRQLAGVSPAPARPAPRRRSGRG